jgi:hypothetical protein
MLPQSRSCAARDETADGGHALGRGMHAHLPADLARQPVDLDEIGAGFEAAGTGLQEDRPVELRRIEDDPALERDELAVVAGPAAAHDERDAELRARADDAECLVLVLRDGDEIGRLAVEFGLQDRAIPEEIAALEAHELRVVDDVDTRQSLAETAEIVRGQRIGHGDPAMASSSR